MNIMFFAQNPSEPSLPQVVDPTFSPIPGGYNAYPNSTYTIGLNDTNMAAHIFYTKDGTSPTHSGDVATGTTFRVGSPHGSVNLPASFGGRTTDIAMLAYVNGLVDSNIVAGEYVIERDPGL